VTKGRGSVGETLGETVRQVTREVSDRTGIDDLPTRKSARLRLEGL